MFPVRVNGRCDVRWKTKVLCYYTQNEILISILTEGRASNPTESINVKLLQSITTVWIPCSGCATSTSIRLLSSACGSFCWKWEHYYVSTFWAKRIWHNYCMVLQRLAKCPVFYHLQADGEKIWNINLIVSFVVVLFTISSLMTEFFFRFHYFSFFVLVKLWCLNIIWSTGASKIIPLFRLHISTTLNEHHVVKRSVLTGHFVQGGPRS